MDQVSDAMPLKTMRGVWRYKEKREGQVCNARLVFEGKDDEPNRGEVRLENLGGHCYDAVAPAKGIRGKWLMKPAKFEGRPSAGGGTIGTIQFNARWKLRSQVGSQVWGWRRCCGACRKSLELHPESVALRPAVSCGAAWTRRCSDVHDYLSSKGYSSIGETSLPTLYRCLDMRLHFRSSRRCPI